MFEFATATRIMFGPGAAQQLGNVAQGLGQRALVVAGRTPSREQPLIDLLAAQGLEPVTYATPPEPSLDTARRGVDLARTHNCDLVVAIGGGSAIDAGKAIAALLTNGGDPLDYLEVIGAGQPITQPPRPLIALPTTAGTGSEVTRNAVLESPAHHVKVSMRSALMLPRVAIVDPVLTLSLPPAATASTGLDALTQLIEPFVSSRANPLTDALAQSGIVRAAGALRRAYFDGQNLAARTDMALASLLGGMALANAGLGAVHGFAAPIGGMFGAAHGATCAALLPHVMAVNVQALRTRAPDSPALARYAEVARLLTGSANTTADDGVAWVSELTADLHIPRLATYGIGSSDFTQILPRARAASSMAANPIALTDDELTEILSRAL